MNRSHIEKGQGGHSNAARGGGKKTHASRKLEERKNEKTISTTEDIMFPEDWRGGGEASQKEESGTKKIKQALLLK